MDPTPVFLTTYEMIIRDRAHLAAFEWRYIIVDEGVQWIIQSAVPLLNSYI